MSRASDAVWIRATVACYRACLYLYPKPVRVRHGEDMLQVLRDRCREVDASGRSRLRMLAMEIFPDAIRSAGASHWSLGIGEPSTRHFLQLVLLMVLAVVLLFRDPVDRWVLDRASTATHAWNQWSFERGLARDEANVRRLAVGLAAGNEVHARIQSAYLSRALADGRRFYEPEETPLRAELAEDRARAVELLSAPIESRDPYLLALAAQACDAHAGCNRGERVRQLAQADAGNAYAWSLVFRDAGVRQDDAAMTAALAAMARSTHYDDYLARTRRDLFAAGARFEPRDEAFLSALARRMQEARFMDFVDFRSDVRMACTPASVPWNPGAKHWIDSHPQSMGDCLQVASLMSNSGSVWPAEWGARLLAQLSPSAEARQSAQRALDLLGRAMHPGSAKRPDGSWRQWTDAEWAAWARTWAQPGSEREILSRQVRD
jgi:hypothetical protein